MKTLLAVAIGLAVIALPVCARAAGTPLAVYDVTGISIVTTAATDDWGWTMWALDTALPAPNSYGRISDTWNIYVYHNNGRSSALSVSFSDLNETLAIPAGYSADFTYLTTSGGGSQTLRVYFPAVTVSGTRVYVGDNGATYTDAALTTLAQGTPTPTPAPTAIPPSPTPVVSLALNVSSASTATDYHGVYCLDIDNAEEPGVCSLVYTMQGDGSKTASFSEESSYWAIFTGSTMAYNLSSASECYSDLAGTWEAVNGLGDTVTVSNLASCPITPTPVPTASPAPSPTPAYETAVVVSGAGRSGADGVYCLQTGTKGGCLYYQHVDDSDFTIEYNTDYYGWVVADGGAGDIPYYTILEWCYTDLSTAWWSFLMGNQPVPTFTYQESCATPTPVPTASPVPTATAVGFKTPTPAPTVQPTLTPATYVSPTPTPVPSPSPVPGVMPDWQSRVWVNASLIMTNSTTSPARPIDNRTGVALAVPRNHTLYITGVQWSMQSEANIDVRWSTSSDLIDGIRFPFTGQGKSVSYDTPMYSIQPGEHPVLTINASTAGVFTLDGYIE